MELKGKRILITGGASGIGLESVKQFLALGAHVIICGRNQDKLDAVTKVLTQVTAIKCDVQDENNLKELYKEIVWLGGIDVLYNNAGVGTRPLNLGMKDSQHFVDASYEMNVNYLGMIRITDLFMDMLKSRKEAAIINTTSVLSYLPAVLAPTYSASKAAARFYTESLRVHLGVINSTVKVFELLPPLVETDLTAGLEEKMMTPEAVVKELIAGIKRDQYTIRVGGAKLLYTINRLLPGTAFGILNPKKKITPLLV
ncbi:SDR family oxidoreductase [Pedobacter sp. L105]|uniref:SDR family oxidoreductase n=1 Tax=Pedobacter sp. L105 TaxID=1641871 RepID=UPI00131C9170|nr:SDR family NAD(P)-dependent oxidoreductase [Pedobacter sp. L105]